MTPTLHHAALAARRHVLALALGRVRRPARSPTTPPSGRCSTCAQYFNGTLEAHGMFTDRAGKVVKRFTVVMDCDWMGDEGVLDEDFTYSRRQKQQPRLETSHAAADGRYTGRADDVVGEAQGRRAGNAFNWNYTLTLPGERHASTMCSWTTGCTS